MTAINYEKYENMSKRQIFNSLENAERRVKKLTQDFYSKLDLENQRIDFLKSKLNEALRKPKSDFVPIEKVRGEYESFKKTLSPEKIAEIRDIKTAEMNAKYDDE